MKRVSLQVSRFFQINFTGLKIRARVVWLLFHESVSAISKKRKYSLTLAQCKHSIVQKLIRGRNCNATQQCQQNVAKIHYRGPYVLCIQGSMWGFAKFRAIFYIQLLGAF
jgi:hypothetical protein